VTQLDFPTEAILEVYAPIKACFLTQQQLKERFRQRTCFKEETFSWLVGIRCVLGKKSRLTTFLSILDVSPQMKFVNIFDEGYSGATSNYKRRFGGIEKKVKI